MSRRSVLLLIIGAVLLTSLSLALSRRDSRDWRANRSRRLFPFPWQDATALQIARPNGEVLKFAKNAKGEWQILLPDNLADYLANQAVDEFAALATLTWREPLRDGKPPKADQATVITATSAAGLTLNLAMGEVSNNLRAVVVDGDESTVYGVSQDLLKFLDWPDERFRKFTLANAGTGQRPNQIVLSPAGNKPELRIVLKQEADGWRLKAPVDWQVDATRLDMLLRWVDRLRADSIEAEMSADLEWFGFTPESAFVEASYPGPTGETKRRVEFGGEAGEGTIYARETSRTPIFALPLSILSEISLDAAAQYPELWRNFYRRRLLNAIGDELPSEVAIERLLPTPAKLTITHTRDRDGDKWKGTLEEAGRTASFPIDPPDPQDSARALSALLTGLSNIRVKTFLADTPPGPETARWTAFPAWRFTSKSADGRENHQLTLYAADADGNLPPGSPFREGAAGPAEMTALPGQPERAGIALVFDNRPAVMEMHGDLAYLLCLPLYRYQAKRLIDLDPLSWSRVELDVGDNRTVYTRKADEMNEQWWRGDEPPEPLMDDNNLFVALLLELSQLKAEGFVANADADAAKFGLDRPEITAIVYISQKDAGTDLAKDGRFRLAVGGKADQEGKQRYARLNDSGPVFLVSGRFAEALGKEYR